MWLPLIFVTAFFISLQEIIGKKIIGRVDPHVLAWACYFFSLPLLILCLFFTGIPPIGNLFYRSLAISSLFLIFASVLYFKAIKHSDLSIAVPMLAFTPVFLLFTSPLILGEHPSYLGILGVVLIVIGSYTLHFNDRRRGFWSPFRSLVSEKGSRYMLMVAVLFSISGNMDKIGVIHSSPIMWILALNVSVSTGLLGFMLRSPAIFKRQIKEFWPYLIILGMCHALGLMAQMFAIKLTLVPYLIAVKRTSIIMTTFFGIFIFKEKGMKERLIGAALMVFGVFMIAFFQ